MFDLVDVYTKESPFFLYEKCIHNEGFSGFKISIGKGEASHFKE
jgi:hypothetical protein|tara:strand:- start:415 stop:546 length:132 start_codon:yes stop_codon:yes gene_type:complete